MARKKNTSAAALLKLPVYLISAWLLAFGFFIVTLPKPVDETVVTQSDAIIVLTGGPGRIETGLDLLEAKKAGRMLISGVHPHVEAHELSALTGRDTWLFTCCVDLDRTSADTIGNAAESAIWMQENGFTRALLVTADYHIPRSRILFRHAMPEVEIVTVAVKDDWPLSMLANEFNKYAVTLVQHALQPAPDTKTDREEEAAT